MSQSPMTLRLTGMPDDIILRIINELYVGDTIGKWEDRDGLKNIQNLSEVNYQLFDLTRSFRRILCAISEPAHAFNSVEAFDSVTSKQQRDLQKLRMATSSLQGLHLQGLHYVMGNKTVLEALRIATKNCCRLRKLSLVDSDELSTVLRTFLRHFWFLNQFEIFNPYPLSIRNLELSSNLKVLVLDGVDEGHRPLVGNFLSEFQGSLDRLEINYNISLDENSVKIIIFCPSSLQSNNNILDFAKQYSESLAMNIRSAPSISQDHTCTTCDDIRKRYHMLKPHFYRSPHCSCQDCMPSYEILVSFAGQVEGVINRARPRIGKDDRAYFLLEGIVGQYLYNFPADSAENEEREGIVVFHQTVECRWGVAVRSNLHRFIEFNRLRSLEVSLYVLATCSTDVENEIYRHVSSSTRSLNALVVSRDSSTDGCLHVDKARTVMANIMSRAQFLSTVSIDSGLILREERNAGLLTAITNLETMKTIHVHIFPRRRCWSPYQQDFGHNGGYTESTGQYLDYWNQNYLGSTACSVASPEGTDPISVVRLLTDILNAARFNDNLLLILIHCRTKNLNVFEDEKEELREALLELDISLSDATRQRPSLDLESFITTKTVYGGLAGASIAD